MKPTAISLIFLLLGTLSISFASALNFNISCSNEINLNESFSVSISAQVSEVYDVKITIIDNSSQKIISQIYSGEWKNPYYYLKSAFPDKTEFQIMAITYSDNAVLCSRLRKTGASSYSEVCKSIIIINHPSSKEAENKTTSANTTKSSTTNKTQATEPKISCGEDFVPAYAPQGSDSSFDVLVRESFNEKVLLNPGKETEKVFVSNDEKIRLWVAYIFAGICILIIILMSLRKI